MARRRRAQSKIRVCRDYFGRTCVVIDESGSSVKYIPLSIEHSLRVNTSTPEDFAGVYTTVQSPLKEIAQLYLNYAVMIGATAEALDALVAVTTVEISDEDRNAALSRCSFADAPEVKQEKPVRRKRTRTPAKPTGEYKSAAQMFRALILEDEKTDDEIFKEVQTAFDLDGSKRSYVNWYRKDLIKKGEYNAKNS